MGYSNDNIEICHSTGLSVDGEKKYAANFDNSSRRSVVNNDGGYICGNDSAIGGEPKEVGEGASGEIICEFHGKPSWQLDLYA